jgi:hypothetical protein
MLILYPGLKLLASLLFFFVLCTRVDLSAEAQAADGAQQRAAADGNAATDAETSEGATAALLQSGTAESGPVQ